MRKHNEYANCCERSDKHRADWKYGKRKKNQFLKVSDND